MAFDLAIPFVANWLVKEELCIMRLVAKRYTLNGVRYLNESFQMTEEIFKKMRGELPPFVIKQLSLFPNNIKMYFHSYYRTIEFLNIWQELIHTPYFDNIHTIDFSGCSYISKLHILEPILERVYILRLYHSNITSIDAFNKIDKEKCKLQVLDLSNNPIKDISPLALIKLKRLDLSNTPVSDISMLSDIDELYIPHTKVLNVDSLSKTRTLSISATKVADISGLLSITNLYMSSTSITCFPLLPELKRLEMDFHTFIMLVSIKDPYIIDAYFFEKVSSLFQNSLEEIHLNGGSVCIYSSNKAKGTKLKLLRHSGNLINTLHHSSLPFISGLLDLDLSYTVINDISVLETLTNLTKLELTQTSISDISVLKYLTNLTYLDISDTGISSFEPLSFLTNLKVLYLSSTNFSDLSHLTNLHKLEKLYLSDTKIKDISLLPFFPKLKIVTLHETDLSDENIEYCRRIGRIDISYVT
jgi:internalin A